MCYYIPAWINLQAGTLTMKKYLQSNRSFAPSKNSAISANGANPIGERWIAWGKILNWSGWTNTLLSGHERPSVREGLAPPATAHLR